MDSTSVGGALQEPEAPEVMFEVSPPAWDRGREGGPRRGPGAREVLLGAPPPAGERGGEGGG